jgi:PAS domain S-box-containing protein
MNRPYPAYAQQPGHRGVYAGSLLISLSLATLLAAAFLPKLYARPLSSILLTLVLVALAVAIGLHTRFLLRVRREHYQTAKALTTTEHEFQSIFDNALDGFLILDNQARCLEANPAALALLGARRDELVGHFIGEFLGEFEHAQRESKGLSGRVNGRAEMRVPRRDGRSVFVEYTVKAQYLPQRDFVVLRDVTARKSAEEQMIRNLELAEAARAEAEAFRKTSLALTQNLSMDDVLDTLLHSLLELVPCESAQVILVEADARLFLAREITNYEPVSRIPQSPATFDARDNRFLMKILATRKSLLIPDTAQEEQWAKLGGFTHLRSWLCVPLLASRQVLGFLSLGDTHTQAFVAEHVRLATSLAIPAAVAIQNARLYEEAAIFRAELEQRLASMQPTEKAVGKLGGSQ